MAEEQQRSGVPQTLQTIAGITWRVLVLLAGVAVLGLIMNQIFPVVIALFLAMLVTALTTPVMNLLHKFLPKVIAMLLALAAIVAGIVVILFVVVRSTINESSKLVASLQSGLSDIRDWLKTGPLQMSDDNINNAISQAESWGTNAAKGFVGAAAGELGNLGTVIIAGSVFLVIGMTTFGASFRPTPSEKAWDAYNKRKMPMPGHEFSWRLAPSISRRGAGLSFGASF